MRATLESTCTSCGHPIKVGHVIVKMELGWIHARCADGVEVFDRNRRLVLSGETFASKAPNTWRRGKSPGAAKTSR